MENQGLPRVLVFGLLGIILYYIRIENVYSFNPGQKGVVETLGDGWIKKQYMDKDYM